MNKFESLMEEFNEKINGADNMKVALIAMEYGKIIDENFSKEDKMKFTEMLVMKMSREDLEKAKKIASLLK